MEEDGGLECGEYYKIWFRYVVFEPVAKHLQRNCNLGREVDL